VAIPSLTLPSTVVFINGIPAISPKRRETIIMERKGWIFSFEMQKIMAAIARTKTIINGTPVISAS
jgi:hypothetical protein